MRCFAWIESAVQAFSNDTKSIGGEKDDILTQDAHRTSIGYARSAQMIMPQPLSLQPRLELDFTHQNEPIEAVLEFWDDHKPMRDSMQPLIDLSTSTPVSEQITKQGVKPSTLKRSSTGKGRLHDSTLAYEYNPAVVAYVSSGRTRQPKTLRRRGRSSTSTIFLNSPLAPVTIIVTTPDDDSGSEPGTPVTNTFNDIRARRIGAVASPAPPPPPSKPARMSTDSLFAPDTSLLMPPTERQIDTRRLRKAREFREVRSYLIDFLNTKSDQFPKKLRCRMMDLYSITEADLDPAVVKKFLLLDGEGRDEGVALEQSGFGYEDGSDADDMKILAMAFRSHSQTPMPMLSFNSQERVRMDTNRPPHLRRGSRELIVQAPPTIGLGALRRRMTGEQRPETVNEDEELSSTGTKRRSASISSSSLHSWRGKAETMGLKKRPLSGSLSTSSLPAWQETVGEETTSPTKAYFGTDKSNKETYPLHKTMSEPTIHRSSMEALPTPVQMAVVDTGRQGNKSLPKVTHAEIELTIRKRMNSVGQGGIKLTGGGNLITSALAGMLGVMTLGVAGRRREREKLRILQQED